MSKIESHEFQAEIRQLLDIVVHSLYTDKEIFIRELVSNAADACEKLRFVRSSGQEVQDPEVEPEIRIATDDGARTISITDSGIGMTRKELLENLGTIARSGSRAFLKRFSESGDKPDASLIGQFGVGFYSSFMVAEEVQVWSRSHLPGEEGHRWISDGKGAFQIEEAPGWNRGTRVLVKLREPEKEYSVASRVRSILERYSNFVPFPIELNGERINKISAIWLRSKSEIGEEEYLEFYRFIGHGAEAPLGRLHFSADAPLAIQALLFVPPGNLEKMGLGKSESQVGLYCRRVLIEARCQKLFPEWLRFLCGVVDSEDLPLNISRESMQDSALMRKLGRVITSRFLKYLEELAEKDSGAFYPIYDEYQRFLKEGALNDPDHRRRLAHLLRFESSALEAGERTSFKSYLERSEADPKRIYYLYAPSRDLALQSPAYEGLRARSLETLFLYDPIDELVMENLGKLEEAELCGAERAEIELEEGQGEVLGAEQMESLGGWIKERIGEDVASVKASQRLVDSPAMVRDADAVSSNMRRLLDSFGDGAGAKVRYDMELNPRHEVVRGLHRAMERDPELAEEAARQLFDNARMAAGVVAEPQGMVRRLNSLLGRLLR